MLPVPSVEGWMAPEQEGRAQRERVMRAGRENLHRRERAERKAERGDPCGAEEGGDIRGEFNMVSELPGGGNQQRALGEDRRNLRSTGHL